MKIKALNKDIRRSITGSMGRFLSIFSLMVLGVFAFVGLKVSGPDMRATAERFYTQHQLADLTVTSTAGLSQSDQTLISGAAGVKTAEFGYFRDVLFKNSDTAIRLFSATEKLSTYEVVSGKMPAATNEIAIDYLFEGKYKLGESVSFSEEKTNGAYVLKNHTFKIVGFVKSSEFVDKNSFGPTTIGTGQLGGYAVTVPAAFDSDVSMIARLSFTRMQGLSLYSSQRTNLSNEYQTALQNLLENQPEKRLAELKKEPQAKIDEAKAQLTTEQKKLETQQNQLNQQKLALQTAGSPIPDALLSAQEQINAGKHTLASSQAKLIEEQETVNAIALPVYTVNDRAAANPGYQSFIDNSTRIDTLSNIFPVVLFAIAALVSLTTMTRFVEEERGNLGLLKALGYTNRQIRRKFMIYGLVSACAGAAVGTILGHFVLPQVVFNAYTASSTFSGLELTFSLPWTLVAFTIAILCTVFPAYLVVRGELHEVPARLFLAKPPKAGSRIFLERIGFIWRKLSFTYKVTARNLFRYKKRMLMTILGVAGCTALLVMGFGIRDSISGLAQRQFGTILHYDMIAVQADKLTTSQQKGLDKLLASEQIKAHTAVHFELLTKVAGAAKNTQQIQLIVPENEQNFGDFVTLQNRISGQKLSLSENGVILSEKLANLLGAKVGENVTLKNADNKPITVRVSGITELYMGHYAFMNRSTYEQAFGKKFSSNANLLTLKNSSDSSVKSVAADFMSHSGVIAISQNNDLKNTINAFLYGINSVMFVLITCAILLAVVVIYNLTNINVSERIRELSTIKVLGFYDREVTMYIYRETILLSFLGILGGLGLGAYFHRVIITMLPTYNVMFNPGLTATNLILSAVITLATTFLLSFMVHWKLKRVDMLGALKSMD